MTRATAREIDGPLVLDDLDGLAAMKAVAKYNCLGTLDLNRDRVAHFVRRIGELGMTAADVVIVLINMDDPIGSPLGDVLMPGTDWDVIRATGAVPFARGLAGRHGVEAVVQELDPEAGVKLLALKVAVVVFDHGVVEVFEA